MPRPDRFRALKIVLRWVIIVAVVLAGTNLLIIAVDSSGRDVLARFRR